MAATLEPAQAGDLEISYAIIDQGREFQKEQGFVQWTDDYPNLDTLREDIQAGKGYVVKVDGVIAGYMYIDFDGEPAYDDIQGQWHTQQPYAVVHRMSFDRKFRGTGFTSTVFGLIEELCLSKGVQSIRVDTDFPNKRMQHILDKLGFRHCGTIVFQGSGKLAYDKVLSLRD